MKTTLLLLFALFGLVFCEYSFYRNITIDPKLPSGNYAYRATSWDDKDDKNFSTFRSTAVELDLSLNDGDGLSVSLDTIAGIIHYGNFPVALSAYWDTTVDVTESTFTTSLINARSLIGQVFGAIVEKDASGNVVQLYDLTTAHWGPWEVESDDKEGLYWLDMTQKLRANNDRGNFTVKITWFVSSVPGETNYGNATVTPRTIESIFRINDYPYANPANKLTLYIGAASASSQETYNSRNLDFGTLTDNARVFLQLKDTALSALDNKTLVGEEVAVQIGNWVRPQDLAVWKGRFNTILTFLNAKFPNIWSCHVNTVTFPAGLTNIIYDPTMGSGAAQDTGAASGLLPSLLAVLLLSIAAVLL